VVIVAGTGGAGYNFDSTAVRLQFECILTALGPFDDLRYDRRPTCVVCTVCVGWGAGLQRY